MTGYGYASVNKPNWKDKDLLCQYVPGRFVFRQQLNASIVFYKGDMSNMGEKQETCLEITFDCFIRIGQEEEIP